MTPAARLLTASASSFDAYPTMRGSPVEARDGGWALTPVVTKLTPVPN